MVFGWGFKGALWRVWVGTMIIKQYSILTWKSCLQCFWGWRCLETSLACIGGATSHIGWTISVILHSLIHPFIWASAHHHLVYSLTLLYFVGGPQGTIYLSHWIQLLEVFYLTRIGFTLDEPVSLVKVFRPFRLEPIFSVFRVWTR